MSGYREKQLLVPVVCLLCLATAVPIEAINLKLTPADIERALVIARGRDREREQFHEPYIRKLDSATVQSIEIVSEFRRVVLLAEDHILRGDRGFAYSTRIAGDALQPWKGRVSVVARLRFHPMNTYVAVPAVEMTVDGPNADAALVGVLKEPQYAMTSAPGEQAALVGAVAEGVFDAALIGQTERTVTLRLNGKELAKLKLDFTAVE